MRLKVFGTCLSTDFAEGIASYLETDTELGRTLKDDERFMGRMNLKRFADGEERPQFDDNIRGNDVFLVQSTEPPAENLYRLCMMIDAAKRASAYRVTAVIPYLGYARQDRKDRPRVPISAELVARLLQAAGADRILTMDMHVNTIEGFFQIPVDHLYGRHPLMASLGDWAENVTVVAPDAGAVNRARAFARRLGGRRLVYIDKERIQDNEADVNAIVGEIGPRNTALITDDLIDTAGTLIRVAEAIHEQRGVTRIAAVAPHALLSGNAISKLAQSCISRIFIGNTVGRLSDTAVRTAIQRDGRGKFSWVPMEPIFGEAIKRIHLNESISSLFE